MGTLGAPCGERQGLSGSIREEKLITEVLAMGYPGQTGHHWGNWKSDTSTFLASGETLSCSSICFFS